MRRSFLHYGIFYSLSSAFFLYIFLYFIFVFISMTTLMVLERFVFDTVTWLSIPCPFGIMGGMLDVCLMPFERFCYYSRHLDPITNIQLYNAETKRNKTRQATSPRLTGYYRDCVTLDAHKCHYSTQLFRCCLWFIICHIKHTQTDFLKQVK